MKWKAILFGLNYSYDKSSKLRGCIHDVNELANALPRILGPTGNIDIYTDDVSYLGNTSKSGIQSILNKMVDECNQNCYDLVILHYSGHGASIKDCNFDESDKFDEALCPSDFKTNGLLTDDDLHSILEKIVSPVKLVAFFDSCHSGSVLDLQYNWSVPDVGEASCQLMQKYKPMTAEIICISGCMDCQTSADAYNFNTREYGGAFTDSMIKLLRTNKDASNNVFTMLQSLHKMMKCSYSQITTLSSSYDLRGNQALFHPVPKATYHF